MSQRKRQSSSRPPSIQPKHSQLDRNIDYSTASSVNSAASFHTENSNLNNPFTETNEPPLFRRADSDLEGGDQRSDSTKLGAFSKLTSILSPNSLIPENISPRKQSDATLVEEEDDDKYTSFKSRSRTLKRLSQVSSGLKPAAVPILSVLQRTRRPSEITRNVEGIPPVCMFVTWTHQFQISNRYRGEAKVHSQALQSFTFIRGAISQNHFTTRGSGWDSRGWSWYVRL